jgi:hypothetical protein
MDEINFYLIKFFYFRLVFSETTVDHLKIFWIHPNNAKLSSSILSLRFFFIIWILSREI